MTMTFVNIECYQMAFHIAATVVPVPINSVTFLTPEAFIRLPNNPEEMKTDFKVILMIKTKQRDSLFMYQPGTRNNQYLAALLKDGRLNVRFNFGGTDELIAVPGGMKTLCIFLTNRANSYGIFASTAVQPDQHRIDHVL